MKRAAIILACLVMAGCVGPKEAASRALVNITSGCAPETVRYRAYASETVREFVMTCEVKP